MLQVLNMAAVLLLLLAGTSSNAGEMNKIDQVVREVVQTQNSWGEKGTVLEIQADDISNLHFVNGPTEDCFVVVGGKALDYDFQVCVNRNQNKEYEAYLL